MEVQDVKDKIHNVVKNNIDSTENTIKFSVYKVLKEHYLDELDTHLVTVSVNSCNIVVNVVLRLKNREIKTITCIINKERTS